MVDSQNIESAGEFLPVVDSELVGAVSAAVGALDEPRVRALVAELKPPDLADLI